ncbi:hypothetical protein KCU88_g7263, partial [Aureobasidium melanogenum]
MAKGIESAAQRHQERQRQKEEQEAAAKSANASRSSSSNKYTPVSSFLTARTVDPDGHPRRVGHAAPRSLAEIVGDENIFTYLHQYFVAILRALGDQFGGLPLAEKPSVYQSVGEESPPFARASMRCKAGWSNCQTHGEFTGWRSDANSTTAVTFAAAAAFYYQCRSHYGSESGNYDRDVAM